ncbi:hypothetical protein BH24CHL5_BH24CHL5_01250 [soil metagenome]
MLSAIDHLILACSDPDAAAAELEAALGLRATGGGRHEAHGTFNRLIWLGDSYVELMGVSDEGLARASWWGSHILEQLERRPAGYAGMALASDDLTSDIAHLRAIGSAISDPTDGQRVRSDGDVVRWRISRPAAPDPELGLVFLIEHDQSAAEWRPADRAARADEAQALGTPARLLRMQLQVSDIRLTTTRLLRSLGLQFRPSLAGRGARDASVGTQTLRLASPAGESPMITIRAGSEPREAELLACRWSLVPT